MSSYDSIAADYDAKYQGPRWDLYERVTMAVARPLAPPGARVLDAGAGTGRYGALFLRDGRRVDLLEPSRGMIRQARQRLDKHGFLPNAELISGSISQLPVADETYDLVFCEGDPLCYVDDPLAALREMRRVTRPGGHVYVSCDNRLRAALIFLAMGRDAQAWACMETGASFDPYGSPVHAFTSTELADLMRTAGFVDVRVAGKLVFSELLDPTRLAAIASDPVALARLVEQEIRFASDAFASSLAVHIHGVGRRPL